MTLTTGSPVTTGRWASVEDAVAVLAGGGMYVASLLGATSPTWLLAVLLVVVGAGLGFFVQVSVLAGQNAVEMAPSADGTFYNADLDVRIRIDVPPSGPVTSVTLEEGQLKLSYHR